MSLAVKLSDQLVTDARNYAAISQRSTPKQIEYWARMGKLAEENPDLTLQFIKNIMLSLVEMKTGEVSEYKFG
jgi:hypothetical protein